MKRQPRLLLLLPWLMAGCSSNPHFTTPKIAPVLERASLGLSIKKLTAQTIWSASYGHGLELVVNAKRTPAAYASNLELELADAARVCAALADNGFVQQWDFLSVRFANDYGCVPPLASLFVSHLQHLGLETDKLATGYLTALEPA